MTILPILDLDTVTVESPEGVRTTDRIVTAFRALDSVRVIDVPGLTTNGIGLSWKESDLRRKALNAGAKAMLIGTAGHQGGKEKIVLTLVDTASNRLLGRQIIQISKEIPAETAAVSLIHKNWIQNAPRTDLPHLRTEPSTATSNEAARNYILTGDDLVTRRDPEGLDRAVECYRKAVTADPRCALAHANLASAIAMRNQFRVDPAGLTEAFAVAKHAIELDPMVPDTHRAEAVCDYIAGRFPEALEAAIRAFELNPTYPRAAGLLGSIANAMGRPDLALRWFYWAQGIESQPGDYSSNIAVSFQLLCEDSAAEAALHEGAEFRPELPGPMIQLAFLRMVQQRYEEAGTLARNLATGFAANPEALQISAEVALFSGRLSEAESQYRKLLEMDRHGGLFSSGMSYLSATGWICLQTSRDAEGRALLAEANADDMEALRIAPRHPQRLYSLAATMAALAKEDEALSLFGKATAAGWLDYRYTRLDPRFKRLRVNKNFDENLLALEKKTEELRRQRPAEKLATNN